MKDVFGKEIEVGDYVIYSVRYRYHMEKAVVVSKKNDSIQIEYLGISNAYHEKKIIG